MLNLSLVFLIGFLGSGITLATDRPNTVPYPCLPRLAPIQCTNLIGRAQLTAPEEKPPPDNLPWHHALPAVKRAVVGRVGSQSDAGRVRELPISKPTEVAQLRSVAPPWYASVGAVLAIGALLGAGATVAARRWQRQAPRRRALPKCTARHRHQRVRHQTERLARELREKSDALHFSALRLDYQHNLMARLRKEVEAVRREAGGRPSNARYEKLLRLLDDDSATSSLAEPVFSQPFVGKLRQHCPALTPSDLRLAAYLRLNLTSKDIAQLLNITPRGVELKRYRLRKRLGLSTDQNLIKYVMEF